MKGLPQRAAALALTLLAFAASAETSMAEKYGWRAPQKPFRIYGNTYYVGSKGLTAILITSPQGDILIDGTLTGNEHLIEGNIRALGVDLHDIKLILNTHAHKDHAGAIAAIAHDTGAQVVASVDGAKSIEAGGNHPDDPQFGSDSLFPAVEHVRSVADGEVVHLGSLAVQAHATPGHTWGSTSWTWTSCEGSQCHAMAYVDSLSLFSRDGYRYNDPAHPERVAAIRHTLQTVAALPCDYLMVPHPDVIDFLPRAAQRRSGEKHDPLFDPHACQAYAAVGQRNLDERIADEAAQRNTPPHH